MVSVRHVGNVTYESVYHMIEGANQISVSFGEEQEHWFARA